MSSESCKTCRGSGECISVGHMPPYKCKRCGGSGTVHYFNSHNQAPSIITPAFSDTVVLATSPTTTVSVPLQMDTIQQDVIKKRGRPPKSN